MSEDKKLKMAVISGASHALKFKEENWKASDDEVIQHITKQADVIIKKIEED